MNRSSVRSAVFLASAALLTLGALCTSGCSPTPSARTETQAARAHGPVSLTYLGVAGWRLDAVGNHTLLVDPYFTRVRAPDDNTVLHPDTAAIARFAPSRADVILVGHSHYDHLMDVPDIAKRTGAIVVGSESTANVARADGVPPEHVLAVKGGDTLDFGPFAVRVKHGLHSLTGQPNIPIPRNVTLPMAAPGYGEGGTLQYVVRVDGRTVLFIGTANVIDGELSGERPDVVVLATGLRSKVPDYTCRVLTALGKPRMVLANHFDDFGAKLTPHAPLGDAEDRADLNEFAKEVHACAPDTRVVVPSHLESFEL